MTLDGGMTFINLKEEIIFGTYFFLDDQMEIHTSKLNTLVDILSNIGGFYSLLIGIFAAIMQKINDTWLVDKAIRVLYTRRDHDECPTENCSSKKLKRT